MRSAIVGPDCARPDSQACHLYMTLFMVAKAGGYRRVTEKARKSCNPSIPPRWWPSHSVHRRGPATPFQGRNPGLKYSSPLNFMMKVPCALFKLVAFAPLGEMELLQEKGWLLQLGSVCAAGCSSVGKPLVQMHRWA